MLLKLFLNRIQGHLFIPFRYFYLLIKKLRNPKIIFDIDSFILISNGINCIRWSAENCFMAKIPGIGIVNTNGYLIIENSKIPSPLEFQTWSLKGFSKKPIEVTRINIHQEKIIPVTFSQRRFRIMQNLGSPKIQLPILNVPKPISQIKPISLNTPQP